MANVDSQDSNVKVRGPEYGQTGTSNWKGIISHDYNPELDGVRAMTIYDEMRKSDGTISALLRVLKLPIRRANWYIKPASQEERDIEIADRISQNLFEEMSMTWDDVIRQALLCLDFGVSVFEKVFDIRTVNGRDMVVLRKLAPRLPTTIERWQTIDGEDGIVQQLANSTDARTVSIPIEKLLIIVNEKEGDNWWGTSILRAPYKHWFFKNNFYKIEALAYERHGLGIPMADPREGTEWDDESKRKAEQVLENLYADEQAYIVGNGKVDFKFMDMKSGSIASPEKAIANHNREILKAALAQFLELGANETGSYALSADQSDLFLQSVEAVANNFVDAFNKYVIKQIVDMNYDNVTAYPQLDYTGITTVDVKGLADAYKTLTDTGAVGVIEADEQFFRENLGLPERTDDDEDIVVTKSVKDVTEEDVDDL